MGKITGKELAIVGGLLALWALTRAKNVPIPPAPITGVTPSSPAPAAYTALAAPSVGGSSFFPSIGVGATGGAFSGAAMGGTYAGIGQTIGQGFGVLAVPNIPNWPYGQLTYSSVGR